MRENELSRVIYDCAHGVYSKLGPGLLESAYEACLCYELSKRGISIENQVSLPLEYEGVKLEAGYRVDILVERKVIIEIKAIEHIMPVHKAQLLTYLRLSGCKLGMLINFNVSYIGEGITRVVNGL